MNKLMRRFIIVTITIILVATVSFVTPPFKGNVAEATAPTPAWWKDNNGNFSQYDTYQFNNGRTHQGTFYSGYGSDSNIISADASYDGVVAIGPTGTVGGSIDTFFTTDANASDELEWQCTELSKRFLYLEYGVASLGGTNGYQVVNNYATTYPTKFYKVPNDGTAKLYPKPGDVLSYGTSSPGHTAVVQSVGGEGNGNATVMLLEQNASGTGLTYQNFQNWQFQNGIDNDPNNTSTVSGWLTPLNWNNVTPSGTTNDSIYGMAAFGASSAWAAGYETPVAYTRNPVTYLNTGSGWTKYYPPSLSNYNYHFLYGIAGNASDAWTVGEYDAGPTQTLVYHWNGSSWGTSRVPSDNVGTSHNYLFGVAYAGSDIFAVGYYYNSTTHHNLPLIEKWNGTKFASIGTLSLPGSATDATLKSVAFSSATDGWAVGSAQWYIGNTRYAYDVYYHYDGSSWTPTFGSKSQGWLNSVAIVSGSEAWAVGGQGTYGSPLIMHYINGSWTEDTSFTSYPTSTTLESVGADSASDVWIAGFNSNPSYANFTMHYNGSAIGWKQVSTPSVSGAAMLQGIAVNSGVAWAGGQLNTGPKPLIFKSL